MTTTPHPPEQSVLRSLRQLVPDRRLTFGEALRIAELQATTLADLIADERGILEHHLAALPHLRIIRERLPISGMSHWNGREWIICLNATDALVRQRFTMLHEYKHVIDHGHAATLYTGTCSVTGQAQAETAADYFAGCALISKRALKAAWGNGIQNTGDLATYFGVSEQAIAVRLAQTGLSVAVDRTPTARCRYQAMEPHSARGIYV